ncbi:HTH_Tnp_Tc3_2 domain-containing protein [Trichonephila clavipes]|nr:HTH_Tnp_Tc3_2 domain-containing protein [Trichonephila clavipes]
MVRRPGQGHKRATTPTKDCYLRPLDKRKRSMTATHLSFNLYNVTGTSIPRIIVVQRFNAGDLYARYPVVCIPVIVNHKKDRVAWYRRHQSCIQEDWGWVLFCDEARFSLQSDTRHVLI